MSWRNLTVEDVCAQVSSGGTPKRTQTEYWENGTIPWLKTGELNDGYVFDAEEKITLEGLRRSSAKIFPRDTVLMAMYGDGRTITTLSMLGEPCSTNQACAAMIVDPEICDPRFLFYCLKQHRHRLLGLVIAGAQRNLSLGIIKKFPLLVPDLPTQERIAGVLSAYDDLIENNRRRIALLERAARLLYREWFVHFRFPGHETTKFVDGLPEGWEKSSLFEVVDVLSGGTPKTGNSAYWGDDIPFFTPKDTGDFPYTHDTEKMITEEGLKNCNSRLFDKDTLFITARGTVGKLRLAQRPMAMNQSCYALVSKTALSQKFLYFAITELVNQLKSRAAGAVFDAIIVDTFRKIMINIPTDSVAASFTRTATLTLTQIDTLAEENRKLTKARDLLLPRLMDGRIPV